VFVVYQLGREAAAAATQVGDLGPDGLREQAARVPGGGEVVGWADRLGVDVEAEVRRAVGAYTRDLAGLAQGSLTGAIQFLVAVYILYHLLRDRGEFRRGLRAFLPLTRDETDRVAARAADSVYANLYADLLTSLIDAVGGGLVFWAVGLPAPLLWAVVMFVLSILPVVGAGMVWFPAVVVLAAGDRWAAAGAVLAWGLLSFLIVDNWLYARLAGGRMRVHEVPALVAFLGGVGVFGLSGMILGPAVLAVTVAFLEVWRGRLARAEQAEV
jgi:predicted PurR-regulated permease PerM